jgi:hypothetical protein
MGMAISGMAISEAVRAPRPAAEIEHHAWRKPGLGNPERDTQRVERLATLDKSECRCCPRLP